MTPTETAESNTPTPNEEAKASAAKPSSTDLRLSWSIPRPRPSDRLPRIANGPTQNSSDALSHPFDEPFPVRLRVGVAAHPATGVPRGATTTARGPLVQDPGQPGQTFLDPHGPGDRADQQ